MSGMIEISIRGLMSSGLTNNKPNVGDEYLLAAFALLDRGYPFDMDVKSLICIGDNISEQKIAKLPPYRAPEPVKEKISDEDRKLIMERQYAKMSWRELLKWYVEYGKEGDKYNHPLHDLYRKECFFNLQKRLNEYEVMQEEFEKIKSPEKELSYPEKLRQAAYEKCSDKIDFIKGKLDEAAENGLLSFTMDISDLTPEYRNTLFFFFAEEKFRVDVTTIPDHLEIGWEK